MNNWTEKKKIAIVESDDTHDSWNRNGLNFLFYWKAKYPKFKISLFTIPYYTSPEMLALLAKHSDWIELIVHGFNHENNFECYDWDYDRTKELMGGLKPDYKKVFKAPGWTITPGGPEDKGGNGYPANADHLIAKDYQAVYRALLDMDFYIFDRHYNVAARPDSPHIICVDDQPDLVHMHTWNMVGPINERNGYQQVEELHGVPWDQDTEFYFVTEAIEKGLFKPCQK